jgi:hypothetical protein
MDRMAARDFVGQSATLGFAIHCNALAAALTHLAGQARIEVVHEGALKSGRLKATEETLEGGDVRNRGGRKSKKVFDGVGLGSAPFCNGEERAMIGEDGGDS